MCMQHEHIYSYIMYTHTCAASILSMVKCVTTIVGDAYKEKSIHNYYDVLYKSQCTHTFKLCTKTALLY